MPAASAGPSVRTGFIEAPVDGLQKDRNDRCNIIFLYRDDQIDLKALFFVNLHQLTLLSRYSAILLSQLLSLPTFCSGKTKKKTEIIVNKCKKTSYRNIKISIEFVKLTALGPYDTELTTNNRMNVITNSRKNAWPVLMVGTVTPPYSKGL